MKVPASYEPTNEIVVERRVEVPMRDGTVLRADVYRPAQPGRYPVLVERVTYELTERCKPYGEYFASRGYVFAGQNTRGTFWSDGVDAIGHDDGWGERRDGYDTVEWAAAQPWSNGDVGMIDGSYSAYTQYLVAPTRPPHLKTLFPRMGPTDAHSDFRMSRGGAYFLRLRLYWLHQWLIRLSHESAPAGSEAAVAKLEGALADGERWLKHLPLKEFPPLEGVSDIHFEDLAHHHDEEYWEPVAASGQFAEIDTPMYHFGGWFDFLLPSTLRAFTGIRSRGRSEHCRANQRLIVGPWVHAPVSSLERKIGDLDFGEEAVVDANALRLQWYDHWLKGVQNGALDGPPVNIFVMGANEWRGLDDWPPPGISYRPFYFQKGGGQTASSLNGGRLAWTAPGSGESADSFEYDPLDPIPSQGLATLDLGPPLDHSGLEGRMLTYSSEVLEEDLTVIGPVTGVIFGSSSSPDTDWVVRLCDVWPDGRSLAVCEGILRARYRDSLWEEELMTPGEIYRFEVDLVATAQVFKPGHRLRVEVTSSDFPRFDRNLNGGGPWGEETEPRVATNTVHLTSSHPSHIVLPVME